MWNDGMSRTGMMDWSISGWNWLFSFHGMVPIFFLAVIIFAGVALLRDWRHDRDELDGSVGAKPFADENNGDRQ